MAKIYFIRHGSTPAHEGDKKFMLGREEVAINKLYEKFKDIYKLGERGDPDSVYEHLKSEVGYHLSDLGKHQALNAGLVMQVLRAQEHFGKLNREDNTCDGGILRVKEQGLKVFVSPQSRAQQTAEIVCKDIRDFGENVDVEVLESLNVIDMGLMTGAVEGEGEVNSKMFMDPEASEKHGSESVSEFMERLGGAFKEINKTLKEGQDVIVCGHSCGIPLLMIMATQPELLRGEVSAELMRLYLKYERLAFEGSVIECNAETKELNSVIKSWDGHFAVDREFIYRPSQTLDVAAEKSL